MSRLRIGTCSWKFPSWEGLVYSAPKGINYLHEYARKYDTVEVDQWFWSLFEGSAPRLPSASDVAEYRASVPDDFRFTVKVPNSVTLTHYYTKSKSDPLVANPYFLSPELFGQFLNLLGPMRDKLGPLMFQFEYINKKKMSGQAEFLKRFGAFVDALPEGPEYALETRNSNWINAELFEFMAERKLVPVLLEGYWMPPVAQVFRDWREPLLCSRAVVIRLHGPDREGMEKETGKYWGTLVSPREAELVSVAEMTRELVDAGVEVTINVNNHFEGSAPLTIRRLRELLADRLQDLPAA